MSDKINISPQKKKLIVYLCLTLATLAVFWQVNRFDFVNLDDVVYVTDNINIKSGITFDGIRWAFGTRYFDLWHPLIWISFMFDYQFHGLNPAGYHLTNLILHILSTLLLFWLFCRMTGALWKSAFIAALFALHPLHVESVAWIAERKDVLSAFFWMLTLCLYALYTEKPEAKRYLLVLFSFVLALLSKPMVVTLPVIMILLDYWPLNRFKSQKNNLILWQLKEKLPFFILSVALAIFTFHAPDNNFIIKHFSLASRLANAPVSFMTYLAQTFWPHDLAIFYPFPEQLQAWQVLGATLLIIITSAVLIAMAKHLPYLFVGWFWYAITILPVIKIIQVGQDSMADRYHYLPSIGITVGLVWGIAALFKNEDMRKKILFPAGLIFIIMLSLLTWKQCEYWKNSTKLFSHAVRVTKNNYLAYTNLGISLAGEGNFYAAIENFNTAINIAPLSDIPLNYYNRGIVYDKCGQYQRAIEDYNEAVRLKPDYIDAYGKRAIMYLKNGNAKLGCQDAQKTCELGNCRILQLAKTRGICN